MPPAQWSYEIRRLCVKRVWFSAFLTLDYFYHVGMVWLKGRGWGAQLRRIVYKLIIPCSGNHNRTLFVYLGQQVRPDCQNSTVELVGGASQKHGKRRGALGRNTIEPAVKHRLIWPCTITALTTTRGQEAGIQPRSKDDHSASVNLLYFPHPLP
ncbi:hypothetical protein VTI74DRAFT_9484 [Chaetomium olivicolor]